MARSTLAQVELLVEFEQTKFNENASSLAKTALEMGFKSLPRFT